MVKAIRVYEAGGPEVMKWEDVEVGDPGPGEVRVKQNAVGLNYIDVYFRTGLYPVEFPATIGMEAAGVIDAVGDGVDEFKAGDRVAYPMVPGAYAEMRCMPTLKVVKLPDAIDDQTAAAMMLKGLTAQYLLFRTYKVQPGDNILVYAAAGGVGLIFGQWARKLGVTLIGTVGSAEKAELAKAHGYEHVINYSEEDFVARVKEITGGKMCDVVYDSVGKDTFPASLDCLRVRGMFVSFGQSSGPIPPFNMAILSQKGSLYATRPTLFQYIATREELEASANALFDVVKSGDVKIRVNQRYALADAAKAHADLEGRKTTGTTVLIP